LTDIALALSASLPPSLPPSLQVLKTLSVTFPVFTPEGNYGTDVGYIIAIGCAFKLIYFAGFYLR
jgi:hypothetical protein